MIKLLFDSEFSLSDSEISEEEGGATEELVWLNNQLRTSEASSLVVVQASLDELDGNIK